MNTSGDVAAPEPIVARPSSSRADDRESTGGTEGADALILWMTGLSGAGKSTIATRVEERLWRCGHHTMLLDGDNLRFGSTAISPSRMPPGSRTSADRGGRQADAGCRADRDLLPDLALPARADAGAPAGRRGRVSRGLRRRAPRPVQTARSKGLYARALAGQIPNFTGISRPTSRRRRRRSICGRMSTTSTPWPSVLDVLRRRGARPAGRDTRTA